MVTAIRKPSGLAQNGIVEGVFAGHSFHEGTGVISGVFFWNPVLDRADELA